MDGNLRDWSIDHDEIKDLKYYLSILDDQTSLYESATDDGTKETYVREIASIARDMACKCHTLKDPKIILTRVLSNISPPNKRRFVELVVENWDRAAIKPENGIQHQFNKRVRVTLGPL